jgi:glycosyltransferase involved in cell wall biosynthesis
MTTVDTVPSVIPRSAEKPMSIMEDRIPLILVDLEHAPGRSQRLIWELATRLSPARFDLQVWLSSVPGSDELASVLAERGVAVERLAAVDSAWDLKSRLAIRARLKRTSPRLLHLHAGAAPAERSLSALVESANEAPLVVTAHAVGGDVAGPRTPFWARLLERADAVSVSCVAEVEIMAREHPTARTRLRVVRPGVDFPDWESETESAHRWRGRMFAGPLHPLWVCAAPLEPGKGHGALLDALAMMRSRGLAFTAALAGEGSLGSALDRRIAELGLEDRVKRVGWPADLGGLLLAADAVVLPSAWESQPLILMEAMARARPVIASSVGGIPELVTDGLNGRLCPSSDSAALAALLESFQRHPDAAMRLGKKAAESVLGGLTWDHTIETYESIYDEVLGLATFQLEEHSMPVER